MATSARPPAGGRYSQQLRRVINVLGNVAIAVSGVTPTASVFIIAPVVFAGQGSGSFYSFVIAAVIGAGMALCWGELGAIFPVAGGSYSIVSRVLGRPVGFVTFALSLVEGIIIPSSIALGAGQYLGVVWPEANANLIGAAIMLVTAGIAILSIRANAWVTGVFLALELTVVLVITALGLTHIHQPASELLFPHTFDARGVATAAGAGVILAGAAAAIFAYNGYDTPVVYSEETTGHRRGIARAILWALAITVVAELVPIVAALLAAPSLGRLASAASPMRYVVASIGGHGLDTVLSLGVALAIFNATIAINLTFGRIFYSSGRDRAWPEPVSRWMGAVHPRLGTPWVATAFVGVVGAILTAVSNLAALVTFTGVILVVIYALIALSAIVSRVRDRDLERPFRMPLWPLPPLVAFAGLALAASQQTLRDLAIVAAFVVAAVAYYALYLRSRGATHWVMREPAVDEVPG